MYSKILVALDHTDSAQLLLTQVAKLATLMKSELLLVHVADGWAARNFTQLNLASSEEMREDWNRLESAATRLREETGLTVSTRLALGSPPDEILKVAHSERVDMIAMISHGHRLVGDIIHGSTIEAVRHRTHVAMFIFPSK
ncbi:MAG: UspA domain protein [Chthoniobacteraceae bacterium]|nr:UspA domain protein [Chthoniobacteraceae bacterium]MDB6174649.1 UspA domain protein [Chthoniobacteraceae bacterium]